MQALVCNSLSPACFSSFSWFDGKSCAISHSKCARDSVHLEKKLLSHIKEKTVSLKRGSKKWVEEAGSRSLPQAIDWVKCSSLADTVENDH